MRKNRPPETYIRVSHNDLYTFAHQCLLAAGLVGARADFLAQRLVECDLRGVISHGTTVLKGYVKQLTNGTINRDP